MSICLAWEPFSTIREGGLLAVYHICISLSIR
jgi:hypothetical protein